VLNRPIEFEKYGERTIVKDAHMLINTELGDHLPVIQLVSLV